MKKELVIIFLSILFISQVSAQNKNLDVIKKPKNLILFIGDGMGLAQTAAAQLTKHGPDKRLAMQTLPVAGLVLTHASDNWTTDSAAGATAMSTGYKTNVGMVGVTPDSTIKETIFELAQKQNIKTGVIALCAITDATPAAFAAHVPQRGMHSKIAERLVNSKLDLILGGGRKYFIPKSADGSGREDGKNIIETAKSNGFSFIQKKEELWNANTSRLLGLFDLNNMATDGSQPMLVELAKNGIDRFSKSSTGFMLMVEGSFIDHKGHSNDFDAMVKETLDFDDAVKAGLEFAKQDGQTLVIITADHETGGLTLPNDKVDNSFQINPEWSTKGHTAIPVPIYAYGPGSQLFTGVIDNTDIAKKIISLFDLTEAQKNNLSSH